MDRFYLENKALYKKLVDQVDASAPVPHFSRQTATPSSQVEERSRQRTNMTICARIRPMLQADLAEGFPCAVYPRTKKGSEGQMVDVHDLHNHPKGRPVLRSTKYRVDKLFDEQATTESMYGTLVDDLVNFATHGGIATLLAYGQTGSGKTFTISELQQMAVISLLDEISATENQMEVYITIADLAGNSAFDLLDSRKPIQVLDDASGVTHLAGATEYRITSGEQVLDLLDQAASFRRTESTRKNDASSRSHSICRIRIKAPDTNESEGVLYMVDLAGSEAARDIASHGADRMRETREINMSLSVLKDCLRGRAEVELARQQGWEKKIHIPTRRSTLTRVLKHVFDVEEGRQCRTVLIACVNPILADVGPTKNTLRYAEMLGAV